MFKDVIIEQNPHWSGARYEQGIMRDYFNRLLEYLNTGMIISLIGVRRAGKSTIVKQLINFLIDERKVDPTNILFLNLEHPYFASYSKEVGYLQKIYEEYIKLTHPKGKIYILLDEIQFFKEWPVFVKSHYEQKKIQFVLTGSNSALLTADFITMLTGRTLTLEIFPLSFKELAQAYDIEIANTRQITKSRLKLFSLLEQFLKYGGFPEVVLNLIPTIAYETLNSYAKSILYQDVVSRLQIRKSIELERLFVYLISNIGKPFSYANLSKLFDLSDKVIKEYIAAFSDSYLLFELEMFDYSLKKQMRYPKKVYSIDPGQVNAVAFIFMEKMGNLLENLVFLELRRINLEIYYYKTQNNLEIDFLAKKHLKMALIQVAWDVKNNKTLEREKNALFHTFQELGLSHGIILTADQEFEITLNDFFIEVLPAYKFFCLSSEQKLKLLKLD